MLTYLSSYGIGRDPSAIAADRPLARAGIVLNARDGYPDRLRTMAGERQDLGALGYHCEELDLRSFWSEPAALFAKLSALDLVWVVGGNSFVLAKAMSLAGFGSALASAGTTYAGYSAGSCVAGPDLQGIAVMDEPDLVPAGYPADTVPHCLGLVPYRIVPHVDSNHEESALAALALRELDASGLAHWALADGQALVVRDGDVRLVG